MIQTAGPTGRLTASGVSGWDNFPFELDSPSVVPLRQPELPEAERQGEGGRDCPACTTYRVSIWSDHHWRLSVVEPSGAPLVLMLEPLLHHDLTDLTDELACEMGLLIVRTAQAIESLANVARAHVSRWGDGSAHLHVFFFARPSGFPQLQGRCLAIWESLLPSIPPDHRNQDAVTVAETITRTYGGERLN